MMYADTGYGPANPQTKYAVLGGGLAFLAALLFIGLVFALGGLT